MWRVASAFISDAWQDSPSYTVYTRPVFSIGTDRDIVPSNLIPILPSFFGIFFFFFISFFFSSLSPTLMPRISSLRFYSKSLFIGKIGKKNNLYIYIYYQIDEEVFCTFLKNFNLSVAYDRLISIFYRIGITSPEFLTTWFIIPACVLHINVES